MRTKPVNIAAVVLVPLILSSLMFGCASQPGPKQSDVQAAAPLTVIKTITASAVGDGVLVTIAADQAISSFSSLKQPDPSAVVLYFPETTAESAEVIQPAGIELIPGISKRQHNGGRTARIAIQLAADTAYEAVKDGDTVQVKIKSALPAVKASRDPGLTAAGEPPAPAPAPPPVAATDAPEASASAAAKPAYIDVPKADSGEVAWVNKIDFFGETDGKSTLAVNTTRTVEYRVDKVSPTRIELRLSNTRIPSYHQRPLITTRFNSGVDRIVPFQPDKKKNESIISIEMREPVAYLTEQAAGLLLVHFDASTIPPRPLEQAGLPEWKRALSDGRQQEPLSAPPAPRSNERPPVDAVPAALSTADPQGDRAAGSLGEEAAALQAMISPLRKTYTGEKIALDFYETDIKNVFRILREVSGKNFAIDKDVSGKVTMTLDQPVPWDHVLDLVLRMNQLGMVQEGQIVRIATQETLKREDDLRKAKLEAYRKAREEVKALEPLITRYIPVSYSSATGEVKPHIEQILTKDRGSVSVDEKNNQIIITDTKEVVRQAEEIVRRIDKVTAQVMIEARVVEVSDTFSRELGIKWDVAYGAGMLGEWSVSTDAAMNFPSEGDSDIGISFARLTGVPFVINARLNALETMGEGRILSSPKILTLDNKKAKIKQGVEYPYLERDSSGGSSVKFKNIDLLLEVTPHVTPDDRISMSIYITKNDVAGITAGVPSVSTNEAETELLVNDGDTIVIGGIIKSSETKGQDGFPLLSRIPILGWAFKNTSKKKQTNELLIFMTPRIVQLEQAVTNSSIQ